MALDHIGAVMLLFLTLGVLLQQPQSPTNWTQFGGPQTNFVVRATAQTLPMWTQPLGVGRSCVVTDGERLFVASATVNDGGRTATETLAALDPQTGKPLWQQSIPIAMLPKQQLFGGEPIQPQATPCVADGVVVNLTFSGLLLARDAKTGELRWKHDLVTEYGAEPVQFGFSASPIFAANTLIVHVGGQAALIAFNIKDGSVIWKSVAGEPSYSTPLVTTVGARTIILQTTRDHLLAVELGTGKLVFQYALPKKGLTNVPTPITLAGNRVVVCGQGWDGVRMLELTPTNDGAIEPKELWSQKKVQYFYTTWASDGTHIYGFSGNVGKRFVMLKVSDGSIVTQELGQTDANVLLIDNELLLCRSDGVVTKGILNADGFANTTSAQPLQGRCWTPPTLINGSLLIRTSKQLACVPLTQLRADFVRPKDSGVSAMDEAFAPKKK